VSHDLETSRRIETGVCLSDSQKSSRLSYLADSKKWLDKYARKQLHCQPEAYKTLNQSSRRVLRFRAVFDPAQAKEIHPGSLLYPLSNDLTNQNLMFVLPRVGGEEKAASLKHLKIGLWSCNPLAANIRNKMMPIMIRKSNWSFDRFDQSLLMTAPLKDILGCLSAVKLYPLNIL
jgi:hypothetical protein